LPTPTISRADLQVQYIAPRNQLEQAIAHVLAEVLKVEKVGLNDNFFDMGGHSLLLVQVQRRLQTELARDIPLMRLLEHTTVRSLAQFLTKVGDHNETLLQKSVERAEKQKSRRRRMPA
jgi:acyl carrier protein